MILCFGNLSGDVKIMLTMTLKGRIVVYSVYLISSAYLTCIASTACSLRYRCLDSIKQAAVDYRRVVVSIPTLIHNMSLQSHSVNVNIIDFTAS